MTIELFAQLVKQAILQQDELSVPGLGRFFAEFVPASFSDKGHSINPPYRSLSFTTFSEGEQMTSNPFEGVSDEDVAEVVAEICRSLRSEGSLALPGLGKLCVSTAGSVFFVADFDLDIFPEGFGLQTISLKSHPQAHQDALPTDDHILVEPVIEVEPEPSPDPVSEPEPAAESAAPVAQTPSGKRFGRAILALVVVFILGLVFLRIAAILAPDFVDSILYTPEQLELLGK